MAGELGGLNASDDRQTERGDVDRAAADAVVRVGIESVPSFKEELPIPFAVLAFQRPEPACQLIPFEKETLGVDGEQLSELLYGGVVDHETPLGEVRLQLPLLLLEILELLLQLSRTARIVLSLERLAKLVLERLLPSVHGDELGGDLCAALFVPSAETLSPSGGPVSVSLRASGT